MDEFVCLRIIQMNGVDLSLFQFDYDMSFGVFFLNADETIYGRYGTRSERPENADKDISLSGLKAAMEASLALHRNYPGNQESLLGKRGPEPKHARAELYPQLQKYTPKINYGNEVAKSCIHCHQVHNAERQGLRDAGKLIPDEVLYLYPMPSVIGLELDPATRATVRRVEAGSLASAAGFQAGDNLLTAAGQPLISQADLQWVLQQTSSAGEAIPFTVRRAGNKVELTVMPENGWRKRTDFGWRVSTWDLRRMALGGMVMIENEKAGPGEVGLKVKGVGKYGGHAVARKAGVREGDEIVEISGISGKSTEAEVIAHILETTKTGDPVSLRVRRGSRVVDLEYLSQ